MVGEIWGLFTHSLLKAIHFPAGFSVFHHFGPCKTIQILEEFQRTEFQSSLKRHKGKYTVSPFRKKLFPRNMRFSQVTNHFQKKHKQYQTVGSFRCWKTNQLYIDWRTTYGLTRHSGILPPLSGELKPPTISPQRVGGEISAKDIRIWEWKKQRGCCALRGFEWTDFHYWYGNFLQNPRSLDGFFFAGFFFVACPEESRVTQKRSAVWIDQCVHQKYYAPREEKLGDALEDGGNGSQRADISVEQCQKDL